MNEQYLDEFYFGEAGDVDTMRICLHNCNGTNRNSSLPIFFSHFSLVQGLLHEHEKVPLLFSGTQEPQFRQPVMRHPYKVGKKIKDP